MNKVAFISNGINIINSDETGRHPGKTTKAVASLLDKTVSHVYNLNLFTSLVDLVLMP